MPVQRTCLGALPAALFMPDLLAAAHCNTLRCYATGCSMSINALLGVESAHLGMLRVMVCFHRLEVWSLQQGQGSPFEAQM